MTKLTFGFASSADCSDALSGGPGVDRADYQQRSGALVVTVEPPQDGDPPWPLRKEFETYRSGTLFVRKPGKIVGCQVSVASGETAQVDVKMTRLTTPTGAVAPPPARGG